MDIPFLYTTLYAFLHTLSFDNKREIATDKIYKYRDSVVEYASKKYEEYHGEEINVLPIDNENELYSLLQDYSNLFYMDDNKVCLNDDISLDDIQSLIKSISLEHPIETYFELTPETKILRDLGIEKIFEFKEKCEKVFFELEKKIENEYMMNPNSSKLKGLLAKRFLLIMNIYANNPNYIKYFHSLEDGVSMDDNFDYYNQSEYIKLGEPYPIDYDLYKKSKFYEDPKEEYTSLEGIIDEFYHYAIFGETPIYKDKYTQHFSQLYTSDVIKPLLSNNIEISDTIEELDDENTINENEKDSIFNLDIDEEEFAFYIIYIYKLNEFINLGQTSLIKPRNRLLYALDDIKYRLYDPANFKKYYEQSLNYDLDEDSFELFENEAKYFIEDVFEGNAGKTIEKLLFTSTYYQLTKNKDIEKILKKYKSYPQYNLYSKIILGDRKKDIIKKKK